MSLKQLDEHYKDYVGCDEAGRGCIGGSLFFVGCKLKPGISLDEISFAEDSKTTSKKKRIELAKRIKDLVDYKMAYATAHEIDRDGLSLSITKCLSEIKEHFCNDKILYDGNSSFKVENIETLVKADAKVSIVAAASILAKTLKDNESQNIHLEYPEYSFDTNSGYINKKHTDAIIKYGYTKYHRKSYNVKSLQGHNIIDRD